MSCWHKRISGNRGMSGFIDNYRTWEVSAVVVVNRVVADHCQSSVVIGSCARFAHFRLASLVSVLTSLGLSSLCSLQLSICFTRNPWRYLAGCRSKSRSEVEVRTIR